MFKKSICTLFLLVAFCFAADAQDKCNEYSEPLIYVTFCAPQNWTIETRPDNLYQKVFGETRDGFTSNINLSAGDFDGSLDKYTDLGVKTVLDSKEKLGASKIEVKSRTAFVADTKGIKVAYDAVYRGGSLRVIQYAFNGQGKTKIVVTASLPSAEADALETIVDASLKTFKVAKTGGKPVRIGTRN